MPDPFPRAIAPMLATLVDEPFDRRGWVYEEKYDGYRIVAFKKGASVRLVTRNQIDRSASFPGVVAALRELPAPSLILDGEICIFDAQGVSRFQLLQRRDLGEPTSTPVYVVFDLLYARGCDHRGAPLGERRRVLEREARESDALVLSRRLASDGLRAFEEARARGLEGIIAKDEASTYQEGKRSDRWLKVKVRREDEFVIGGFTPPRGSRTHFGALLVGAFVKGKLRFAGKVGTGFDRRTLADLARRMAPLVRKTSPFDGVVRERPVTWIEPELVGQFAYGEITRDGLLRQPVFLGLREDKPATKVTWPAATANPRPNGR
jgi:bifunctional non-homologous end joining protein LigD